MSTTRLLSTLMAVAVLSTACADSTDSDSAGTGTTTKSSEGAPASAEESAEPDDGLADTAPDGTSIPDGAWAKTATTADAQRLGIPRSRYRTFLGKDGEGHVELRIDGDNFAQFSDDGSDGSLQVGDLGTAGYDADGRWVTTSRSTGCFGCVATIDWTVKGRRLTLTLVDTTEVGDPVELLIGRLVYEGTYTRAE